MSFLTSPRLNPLPTNSHPFPKYPSFLLDPEFRLWKRPRLKRPNPNPARSLPFRNELHSLSSSSSPFEFLSLIPSHWFPPAAIALALALVLSKNNHKNSDVIDDKTSGEEEWTLFTTPTPFNRFVLLRCPSIAFEGGELLESVNERLIKEERHYVRLYSGRIVDKERKNRGGGVEEVEYQRECVVTEDGGVISMDWPANLELREERGMDTTVVIVPGTAEGSMEEKVREFVKECLRRGLFPVVMNPRGCAGSPLTTARLFTAADSDDVSSAIQFVARARPWSTLTGVGWGYGANMLTKYLAESGEKTPLTAATCIDNPFDLDEATRTSSYNATFDKKLTRGLIDILKSNKELFQGRRKSFDVDEALAAESVRDFEKAISMVSYGYETIEEFYAKSSTRSTVENLKIPVLFIQNDDGTVPLFSIPRGGIAENPFTSLLLCSCVPSNVVAISWYQQVTIEWLTAVELGLLKGRHPLLQDIDVTINPSKGLALVEGRTSGTDSRLQNLMNLAELDCSEAYVDPMKEILTGSDVVPADTNLSRSNTIPQRTQGDEGLSEMNGAFPSSLLGVAEPAESNDTNSIESDTGQVLQSAQVVMKMLDVTMPGTLKEDDKKKVLQAVGRGETVIKALQDAVPEDVRGKLTTSVSEIIQAQGKNLNLDGLLSFKQIANVSSDFTAKIRDKANKQADTKNESIGHSSAEKLHENDERNNNGNQNASNETREKSVNSSDRLESKALDSHRDDAAKGSTDLQNTDDKVNGDASVNKGDQLSEFGEDGSTSAAKVALFDQDAGSTKSKDAGPVEIGQSQDDLTKNQDAKESDMSARKGNSAPPNEQGNTSAVVDDKPDNTNKTPQSTISEGQVPEKGEAEADSSSKDAKIVQPSPDQNRVPDAKSPGFNVTQALDAFTGLDDSTQIAVNSVFGVIEDMITQLEEKKNEEADRKKNEENSTINGSANDEPQLEKKVEEEIQENADIANKKSVDQDDSDDNIEAAGKQITRKINVGQPGSKSVGTPSSVSRSSSNSAADPMANALYPEYLQKYILSKMHDVRPFDADTATDLFFHYVPEEGHWILLEKPSSLRGALSYNSNDRKDLAKSLVSENDVIEPSYVILDKNGRQETEDLESREKLNDKVVNHENNLDMSKLSVKNILLDSLKVEVSRRLSVTDLKDMEAGLAADIQGVVEAVCLAIQNDEEHHLHSSSSGVGNDDSKFSRLNGNHFIEAISEAVQKASHLKRILPVGVVVGSTLAALRNCPDCFEAATALDRSASRIVDLDQEHINGLKTKGLVQEKDNVQFLADGIDCDPALDSNPMKEEESVNLISLDEDDGEMAQSKRSNRDNMVVGAVTAALGASALLTSQQEGFMGSANSDTSLNFEKKHMKAADDKHPSNIVSSLAEKAMSVAAPVVPTKEGGEVDHERIVGMLAELGQRGGVLRLVAKFALLWGGLRGAMSLTDRLISFLRVAERPLMQRILGFSCMVLVLWTPVLVPLLPTLFHNMATHNSSRIAELACIVGLYTAVTILIVQWGRRLRGYEFPLKQYGLDLASPRKVQDFFMGLAGGVSLILCIHSVNALLGLVNLSVPANLTSSSLNLTAKLIAYSEVLLLAGRALLMAVGVAFVEELLFRSWLLEEIADDLGDHLGIILSGLAFAISQRSLLAIPGLWLLSICLSGTRLRKEGNLFIPIGLRTGIMSSSFILQMGGFLSYQPKSQLWIAGMHPYQPFSGVVGLLFVLLLALALYPRQPGLRGRVPRPIRA